MSEITVGELFENADLMAKFEAGSITVSDRLMFIRELRRTSTGTFSMRFHHFSPASELLTELFGEFTSEVRASQTLYLVEVEATA